MSDPLLGDDAEDLFLANIQPDLQRECRTDGACDHFVHAQRVTPVRLIAERTVDLVDGRLSPAQAISEGFKGDVLVAYGDTPLVTAKTLGAMVQARRDASDPAVVVLGIAALLTNIFARQQEARNPFYRVVALTDTTTDPAVWGQNFPQQYDGYRRTVDQERTRYGGSEALPHPPSDADPRTIVAQSRLDEDPRLRQFWAGYAFGTDTGVSPHGDNAQEFALMVRNGMSPAAAIRSATVDAATLLGREDRIGTIEPGKEADIIAVEGDPTDNVRLLENVSFVMRHGRVHKLGGERQLTNVD